MAKTRTLAFEVSEEFYQKVKDYLARYEQVFGEKLSQRKFVIGLIEQALEEAEEDFEAAIAAKDEGEGGDPLEDTSMNDVDTVEDNGLATTEEG